MYNLKKKTDSSNNKYLWICYTTTCDKVLSLYSCDNIRQPKKKLKVTSQRLVILPHSNNQQTYWPAIHLKDNRWTTLLEYLCTSDVVQVFAVTMQSFIIRNRNLVSIEYQHRLLYENFRILFWSLIMFFQVHIIGCVWKTPFCNSGHN